MTKSVSPFGMTTAQYKRRLEGARLGQDDPEIVMMRMWEELNTPDHQHGIVPAVLTAHRCNDGCGRFECSYQPLAQSDVELMAATVQWLACPAGRNFLIKFLEEIGYDVDFNHGKKRARATVREAKADKKDAQDTAR